MLVRSYLYSRYILNRTDHEQDIWIDWAPFSLFLFGEELENLELRFDNFQQNIASHPVVQVEFILWFIM